MEIKLRSTVRPEYARRVLFRGTLLAVIGIAMLVLAGVFIPAAYLGKTGFVLFVVALGLVTWGLLPYRMLMQLETKPDEILIDSKAVSVAFKRRPTLMIPISAIRDIKYLDNDEIYGIQIWLDKDPVDKVMIQDPYFKVKNLRKYGADLFLPYFSKNSFNELVGVYEVERENHG